MYKAATLPSEPPALYIHVIMYYPHNCAHNMDPNEFQQALYISEWPKLVCMLWKCFLAIINPWRTCTTRVMVLGL